MAWFGCARESQPLPPHDLYTLGGDHGILGPEGLHDEGGRTGRDAEGGGGRP